MGVKAPRSFPHSRLITRFVTRLTRRVPLVEQELLTLPEHMSSPAVFSWVRVTRSLVLYVCFVDCCLSILLYFLFWRLCCLFFFDIRFLISPLVSSSSSYFEAGHGKGPCDGLGGCTKRIADQAMKSGKVVI